MNERYLEDFALGQIFGSGRLRIEEERIKSFAAEFDLQPFHLDPAAAQRTVFRGLADSGWHCCGDDVPPSRERAQARGRGRRRRLR